ncbi:uncharacterized protein SOCE836_020560 [Sorangium cellulosum]|uniref:Uncharacterized protein n=1 Tax=Sorangium cellulosum TaxID=56 RepID=A0A4P2QJX9_SORCE|nr:uncharacterized protein SOCE836_020560 [Sorangium cellulosum]WCQ89350.1 hypothetical protein NQZ70_02037 [Sorangium sp. Soce836]
MGQVLFRRRDVSGARAHAVWAMRADVSHPDAPRLLPAIKARESLLLGLWCRMSSVLAGLGPSAMLVFLAAVVTPGPAAASAAPPVDALRGGNVHGASWARVTCGAAGELVLSPVVARPFRQPLGRVPPAGRLFDSQRDEEIAGDLRDVGADREPRPPGRQQRAEPLGNGSCGCGGGGAGGAISAHWGSKPTLRETRVVTGRGGPGSRGGPRAGSPGPSSCPLGSRAG